MNENWLTSTVFAICNGMRSRNDYSELPLLADALEDAGCTHARTLQKCREPQRHMIAQRFVCMILGGELAKSAMWLTKFTRKADCPGYEDTVSAAIGINIREDEEGGYGGDYYEAGLRDWGELCLHFGGRDAHGSIPPEFWDHVARVTGKEIPQSKRASSFSCSC